MWLKENINRKSGKGPEKLIWLIPTHHLGGFVDASSILDLSQSDLGVPELTAFFN